MGAAFSMLLAALIGAGGAAWATHAAFRRRIQKLRDALPPRVPASKSTYFGSDELGELARSWSLHAASSESQLRGLKADVIRREAILASMAEGVLVVDRELRVRFLNPAFVRAVGWEGPVADEMPVIRLVRDPEFMAVLRRVLASALPETSRFEPRGPQGRSFRLQVAPLTGPDEPGLVILLYDITDLERLERIRTDFVANVSHELRTPLASIRGYAETLLEGALDDAQNRRRFVEIIDAHATRLNNIASDLLALSELESGAPAEPVRIPLADSIHAALRTVEREAHLRGVKLMEEPQEDDVVILGNKAKFEQALINLLDNAIKFNRSGGSVTVASQTSDDGVRVSISDTGIGIPSQDLPRIFERFYRVDKARSRESGGTGLGLAIVKHIVLAHGGRVWCESELGNGASFHFTLPLAPVSQTESQPHIAPAQQTSITSPTEPAAAASS